MEAAWERLVRLDDRMVCLFQPPFDKTDLQPGYIKGYLPGIRENGGQYTHAALWVVEAWARLGEGNRAMQLYELLGPQHHTDDDPRLDQYKVEPYVVAADIYGESPHRGRGGWTWYTGSAAWMYRVALEQLLGFRLHDRCLQMDPCIPAAWEAFTVTYRHNRATFRIRVENPEHVERGVKRVTCDGAECPLGAIPLATASGEHEVRVEMGKPG